MHYPLRNIQWNIQSSHNLRQKPIFATGHMKILYENMKISQIFHAVSGFWTLLYVWMYHLGWKLADTASFTWRLHLKDFLTTLLGWDDKCSTAVLLPYLSTELITITIAESQALSIHQEILVENIFLLCMEI